MKKQKSIHAQAAQAIRKELKENFPDTKFSVTSESFAGGNSVHVNWEDGPLTDTVNLIIDKYQYGTFNGMIDMYEYTNKHEDIPQVKYVMGQRSMSSERRIQMAEKLKQEFNVTDDTSSMKMFHIWYNQALHRAFTGSIK